MKIRPASNMRRIWPQKAGLLRFLSGFFISFILLACGPDDNADYRPTFSDAPPSSEHILLFGIHPLHNPQQLFRIYQPLIDYLNDNLTDVKIKLEASRNYASYEDKLFSGKYHFTLPNPYQTVLAARSGYHVFGKMGDDDSFRGIILVRRDSDIHQAADLKGKAISYPAPTALAATLLPQWHLHNLGLDVMRDVDNRYVGSQESSIMNVAQGLTAAGATWLQPWRAFVKARPEDAKQLKIMWETENLPNNGLMARNDMPADVVQRVGRLLFELHTHETGRAILARMELGFFEPADEATYQPVRDFLARFAAGVRPLGETP